MLVFSDQNDLEEINEKQIYQQMEDIARNKMQRKQEIYREMADS